MLCSQRTSGVWTRRPTSTSQSRPPPWWGISPLPIRHIYRETTARWICALNVTAGTVHICYRKRLSTTHRRAHQEFSWLWAVSRVFWEACNTRPCWRKDVCCTDAYKCALIEATRKTSALKMACDVHKAVLRMSREWNRKASRRSFENKYQCDHTRLQPCAKIDEF